MTSPLRVYVAASSAEGARARRVMDSVNRLPGCVVAHDWLAVMERAPAPDRALPRTDAAMYAAEGLAAVASCDVFWLLAPMWPTRGAWVELGVAISSLRTIIVSGDCAQSIFCALGREFEQADGTSDEDAFTALREILASRRLVQP